MSQDYEAGRREGYAAGFADAETKGAQIRMIQRRAEARLAEKAAAQQVASELRRQAAWVEATFGVGQWDSKNVLKEAKHGQG